MGDPISQRERTDPSPAALDELARTDDSKERRRR